MTTTHEPTTASPGAGWRLAAGAASGAVATLAMTLLMLATVASDLAPMPKPIPVALAAQQAGALEMPRLFALGMLLHFAYGAGAGAVLALAWRLATPRWGLVYGVLLWLVMGAVWLPVLGWGPFGTGESPAIAFATLVLHLVYGGALGLLLRWLRHPRGAASMGQHA